LQKPPLTWHKDQLTPNPGSLETGREPSPLFKWRRFEAAIIFCAVRWCRGYALSYRDVEDLMREGGVRVDHTPVFRWVQRYAPELGRRCRPQL